MPDLPSSLAPVVVVGCGVIGLTSAIRLQEAGFETHILTKAMPADTTSAVAAAVWYPYLVYPRERVLGWSRQTLDTLYDLSDDPATGCHITTFIDLFEDPIPDPWWKEAVRHFRHAATGERPPGYADGFAVEVPLVETPVFLAYLEQRFRAGGGRIEMAEVTDLATLRSPGRLVVNCTGLGAAALMNDSEMSPVCGQVVRVSNPGLTACIADDEGPLRVSYIIPRTHDCILGGTAVKGLWNLEPDPEVTDTILRNCRILEPRLREAEVLEVKVGLRPGRTAVRLESAPTESGGGLIHNYGHGGAGFTLCWGCADEVLALAQRFIALISTAS